MKRALLALFIAPVLVSGVFGVGALVVLPFMLAITAVFALPLLFLLRRLSRLNWWHALLAGAFCGACFVTIDTLLSYGRNLDRLIDSNNVLFVGLGATVGLLYWWIGIFRNPAFPFVSRDVPRSMVLVLPLAMTGIRIHRAIEPSFYQGRVVAVLREALPVSETGQVSVRLSGGAMVQADYDGTWPVSMVQGRCFHLTNRWSTFRGHRVYELISPFGGGVDDC